MEGESRINRSIFDEHHSLVFQGDQMEIESGITRSIIDEVHSLGIKLKVKVVLLEVSLMKFILRISNENKWEGKVVLLQVSLMNFILRIWSNGT